MFDLTMNLKNCARQNADGILKELDQTFRGITKSNDFVMLAFLTFDICVPGVLDMTAYKSD